MSTMYDLIDGPDGPPDLIEIADGVWVDARDVIAIRPESPALPHFNNGVAARVIVQWGPRAEVAGTSRGDFAIVGHFPTIEEAKAHANELAGRINAARRAARQPQAAAKEAAQG